ncbi:minichromosome maintenance MCM2/3/5 family protein [Prunus dulcis]|uniref:Minichromosome maintenance MCM2/3/5 family protein n=1 Tax=Prunus dulcis TaxID=3755 RepID=A0A4Y1RWY8_PRUDU|nr:minichromosome maintenance MCM2/3/5 family protein [Prunus dulcis]
MKFVSSFVTSKIEKEEDSRKKNWSNQYWNPQSAHQSVYERVKKIMYLQDVAVYERVKKRL